jgi:hypothetical protein
MSQKSKAVINYYSKAFFISQTSSGFSCFKGNRTYFYPKKLHFQDGIKSILALQEGQMICGECGAPMGDGVIQANGTIRFVCTRNSEHILFVTQNN